MTREKDGMDGPVNPHQPMTEDEIIAATVGERKPLNSTIDLVPYDPDWPAQFARLADRVKRALGDRLLQLEHVGSTSVPGLAAKPVIDMVLAVADSSDEESYVRALEDGGFELRIREPAWFEHRMLKSQDPPGNLHVFSYGSEEIARMLLFRDWLRTHTDDRLLYEQTKRTLAMRRWKHTQTYADAKSEVVLGILARAGRGGL